MQDVIANTPRYKCHCVHAKEIRQLHGHGNCCCWLPECMRAGNPSPSLPIYWPPTASGVAGEKANESNIRSILVNR